MLRRLLLGFFKGGLVGGALGAILVFGFGITALTGLLAYATSVGAGILVALVAGKPIWAKDAWVEVLLKAVAAAPAAAGLVFAAHHLLRSTLSLGSWGTGTASQLPLVLLPLVATLLATFFEMDNTDEPDAAGPRRRVGTPPARTRLEEAAEDEELLESAEQPRVERR
jgi:hypothetical protein